MRLLKRPFEHGLSDFDIASAHGNRPPVTQCRAVIDSLYPFGASFTTIAALAA